MTAQRRWISRAGLAVVIVWVLACAADVAAQDARPVAVFTDWSTDGPLQILLNEKGPIARKVALQADGTYLIDGRKYRIRRAQAQEEYEKLRVESKLIARDGALEFNGKKVHLPDGVLMRSVWQAILVNGWVVCIGRTSRTDAEYRMEPPFVASELVTFSLARMRARVRSLVPDVPQDPRIFVVADK